MANLSLSVLFRLEVCVPDLGFGYRIFFPEKAGNSQSRAFKTGSLPVPSNSRLSHIDTLNATFDLQQIHIQSFRLMLLQAIAFGGHNLFYLFRTEHGSDLGLAMPYKMHLKMHLEKDRFISPKFLSENSHMLLQLFPHIILTV